jgi:hypothetical protein
MQLLLALVVLVEHQEVTQYFLQSHQLVVVLVTEFQAVQVVVHVLLLALVPVVLLVQAAKVLQVVQVH